MIELQLSLLSELERITLWKRKKQHLGCRQQDDVGDHLVVNDAHPLVSNHAQLRKSSWWWSWWWWSLWRGTTWRGIVKRWRWWQTVADYDEEDAGGGGGGDADGDRRARLTWRPEKRMEEEEWARMFSGKLTLSDWFLSHRKKGFVNFWNSISHI